MHQSTSSGLETISSTAQSDWDGLLSAVALKIRQSLNLDEILDTTVAQVRQLLNTDRVVIYRFNPDWNGKVVVESVRDPWMSVIGNTGEDNCLVNDWAERFKQGEVTAKADILAENVHPCQAKLLTSLRVRANLVVPLLQGEELWGLLIAHHCQGPRQWQEAEIAFLQKLAVQVAIALRQAELYQQTQTEIARFKRLETELRKVNRAVRALSDCNQAVVKATTETELLNKVCQILVESGGYRLAWVFIPGKGIQTIKPSAQLIEPLSDLEAISNACWQTENNVCLLQNLTRESPESWKQKLLDSGCHALINLPLVANDNFFGVLVICAAETNIFDLAERELLSELADNLAYGIAALQSRMALEQTNNLLEQKVRDRTAQLQQANEKLQHKVEEQQQTTAKLRDFTLKLERSNRDLQDFAYVASHDLQEPLRAVTSYAQLLAERYKSQLDAKADKYITHIVEGGKRMQQLIHDLLAYSRVETQGQDFQPTSMQKVLELALANLKIAIQEKEAVIDIGPLPLVMADQGQLVQLFQNLLSNALKFHGDTPPQIQVWAEQTEWEWLFAVRDRGIGIEPEDAERIFVIFQRLHTRKKYPGTGIGLAICQKIVHRHGGRIWLESEPGKGSTFYFTLPPGCLTEVGERQ